MCVARRTWDGRDDLADLQPVCKGWAEEKEDEEDERECKGSGGGGRCALCRTEDGRLSRAVQAEDEDAALLVPVEGGDASEDLCEDEAHP